MDFAGTSALVVDDEAPSRRLLQVHLRALGIDPRMAADGREALAAVQEDPPAFMLLDLHMPHMSGMELLRSLRSAGVDVPVIVITAHGSIETVVEAMKEGAYDFLPKPFDPAHLTIVVRKALERGHLLRANRLFQDNLESRLPGIIGASAPMRQATDLARKAASSNATVLLLGDSGTGKEVFAHAIHRWSARRDQPLVIVNCVALSEHLLESELFGHERGAFTGAHQGKKGKFELAHGGTVFLDEIGDMPASLQSKLLRVLQDHSFERVGGVKPIHTDIRVIAATNRNLETAVKEGRFREDLFYRLNVVRIVLPPLRDRMEDLPELAAHLVRKYAADTKKPVMGVSAAALAALQGQPWPGNVRELANVIERAVVLCQGDQIEAADLQLPRVMPGATNGADEGYHARLKAFRRDMVRAALREAGGNQTKAAERLRLQRSYLVKLLRALELRNGTAEEPDYGSV